jgi:hypothetical protein
MGSEVPPGDCEAEAPCPPFQVGTRILFETIRPLEPTLFTNTNPDAVYEFNLTDSQLNDVRERFKVLYTTGKIIGWAM